MPGWSNYVQTAPAHQTDGLVDEAVSRANFPFEVLRDKGRLASAVTQLVEQIAAERRLSLPTNQIQAFASQVIKRLSGYGFLDDLLPPKRTDIEEIMVNSDGLVSILRKSALYPESLDVRPSVDEVWRAVETLLGPMNKAISEAVPAISARMRRTEHFGGARIQVIHPVVAPGGDYPVLSIRLFEPRPVPPEQILAWGVAPGFVLDALLEWVAQTVRVMVLGGTRLGKTTLLSALCHGIPREARIVKVEDPEEIWLPHQNVVTIEARPKQYGVDVTEITLADGVDLALRLAPNWLIVGEVRTGQAALALFRAQMSDHPGLTTFHAESPIHGLTRLMNIAFTDAGVRGEAVKGQFVQAVDLVVQLGWMDGRRVIEGVWEVAPELKGGNVKFIPLYQHGDGEIRPMTRIRRHLWPGSTLKTSAKS